MQIHELKRKTKLKKSVSVGRGGKRGKTSGRGTKGQKARAGHKIRPEWRDIIKRLPKLRGYSFKSFKEKPMPVNVATIELAFGVGETVSPETLAEKGIIEKRNGKMPAVKILADGDITKAVNVSGCAMSAGARSKIEKAGGKIA